MRLQNFKVDNDRICFQISDINPLYRGIYLVNKDKFGVCHSKIEFENNDKQYALNWHTILKYLVKYDKCQLYIMACEYLTGKLENIFLEDNIDRHITLVADDTDICNIIMHFIKANDMLRIDVSLKFNERVLAKRIENSDSYIDFEFDKKFSKYDFYLAKRQRKMHDKHYDIKLPIDKIIIGGGVVLRIYKKGGFQGYIKDGGEIWELLIKLGENNFISCESTIQYSYDYYDENDLFQIKPFISDSIFIAFWTKIKYVNKKIKVAIWGSCFTREPFHAIDYFNPDYKKWYEVVYTAFHHTFASAMSKPLNIPIIKHFEGEHYKLHNLYADNEYNKTMLKSLEQLKPDYLIVDLFAEANSSIYDLGDNNYISDSFYLMNQVEFKAIPKVNKITIQDEKRFEIFKSAVLLFKKRISEIIPLDRIILVSCRPAFKKNIEGKVSDWENVNWLKMSCNIWDKCDGYFLEIIPEAKHIDMRDIEGISTDASPLNLSINHLQSFYYKEVLNRINKAVLTDMLGEK